ncbi:hypothetical protein HYH02_003183 [Chlamydomonas schloesseri]|uniref:Inosine/uridine-preferring nucleoside hydrolase domain-containing protein n=1 Tax=Chlamydomonas schloesseri TaxID=2026947 RepID=A0A836B9W2_9CHLO|nr:hypothetical protein HYH02_003183 [Chlamydomonas schloesseri]|eukprot:KAG2452151.1 hypothetical protein HYH02_003183 [Chlamydomonas schloesseri]
MAIPVWLDCDPGHDDATAILLAGHTPGLKLLGVSTIGGNQTLAKVTKNALDVLDAVGLSHIDVVAGQPRPLMRKPMLCPEIHGDSGLDGPAGGRLLPRSCRQPLPGKAVNVMFEAIAAAHAELLKEHQAATAGGECGGGGGGGEAGCPRVRLVCTGALTNAALLLTLYPEASEWVEVVLMGGAMGVGNTGPVMEFNIQTDPEAAKIVFESGVPLTMVPLEVTHTVLATPQVLADIGAGGSDTATTTNTTATTSNSNSASSTLRDAASTAALAAAGGGAAAVAAALAASAASPFRHAIQELLLFFADTYKHVFKFDDPPLHDPVAVAYVIAPQLFEVRRMRVDIETISPLSAGQTVCDVWGQSPLPPNADVALAVDVPAFWRLLLEAVARADAVSPLNGGGGSGSSSSKRQ